MHVQVEPGSILVLVRGAVEEDHLTLVPALVRLTDVREVEACGSVGGVRRHPRHPAFVPLPAVRWVALVPNVDWDVLPLNIQKYFKTLPYLGRKLYLL